MFILKTNACVTSFSFFFAIMVFEYYKIGVFLITTIDIISLCNSSRTLLLVSLYLRLSYSGITVFSYQSGSPVHYSSPFHPLIFLPLFK